VLRDLKVIDEEFLQDHMNQVSAKSKGGKITDQSSGPMREGNTTNFMFKEDKEDDGVESNIKGVRFSEFFRILETV